MSLLSAFGLGWACPSILTWSRVPFEGCVASPLLILLGIIRSLALTVKEAPGLLPGEAAGRRPMLMCSCRTGLSIVAVPLMRLL